MKKNKTSRLAILGAKWVSLGIISQKIYQIVIVVILARLLTPKDFGLVAIALLTLNTVNRFKELGMPSALIRRKGDIQDAANALFFSNCFLAILIYGVIFAAAPYIATFFENDTINLVLKIMALQLLAEAFSAVQRTLAIKELKFKKQTIITVFETTIAGIISVVLAFKGFGVWALVYGSTTGALLASVTWFLFSRWRPTLSFSWKITKEMLGFGVLLFAAATLERTVGIFSRIFIGRILGIVSLGFYDLSSRVIYLPFNNIISVGQQVAIPAFCQVQEDLEQIKKWYLKMISYSCLFMAPISVCFLLLADHFVPVIYGEQWMQSVPLIRILALFAFMMPFLYSWPVYISTGRVNILLKFMTLRLIVTVPLLFFAAKISIVAFCTVELITICIFAPINLYIVMKLIKIPLEQLISIIKIPLMGTASFTLTLVIFRHLSSYLFDSPNLISLVIVVLPASASYILTIYFRHPEVYSELKNLIGVSLRQEKVLSVSKDTSKKAQVESTDN